MATGFLYLNTRNELIRLDCSKIVYMEGDGNYTGSYNIVVFLTICISYANNCFTL